MGIFSSFKNQIGRDTGKVVSNLVWGDKHASVYRRARSNYESKKVVEHNEEEYERVIQEQKIGNAKSSVDEGVLQINIIKIPQKKDAIIEMLQELTIMLVANPWKSIQKEENKITNRYSDALLMKYEQALFTLKSKFPKEIEIRYFERQFVSLRKTRNRKKYSELVLLIVAGVALFSFIGIMAYFENAEKVAKPDFFEKIKSIFEK
jgi:hypothetical protein